mgnify:FL=1
MNDAFMRLLGEIRDNLALLVERTAKVEAESKKEIRQLRFVSKSRALVLTGISKSTLDRWLKRYSGIRAGKNLYDVARLKEIKQIRGQN